MPAFSCITAGRPLAHWRIKTKAPSLSTRAGIGAAAAGPASDGGRAFAPAAPVSYRARIRRGPAGRRSEPLPLTLSLSDSETKIFCPLARQRRAPQYKQTRRLLTNRHAQALSARVLFQRTATRQQWVVQRLYNDAVNETVELRLLTVFQHAGAAYWSSFLFSISRWMPSVLQT